MSKLFTDTEIKILSKNSYVKAVTPKGITYSDEFKRIFITEFSKEKLPREIIEEYGFNIEILGTGSLPEKWEFRTERHQEEQFRKTS